MTKLVSNFGLSTLEPHPLNQYLKNAPLAHIQQEKRSEVKAFRRRTQPESMPLEMLSYYQRGSESEIEAVCEF